MTKSEQSVHFLTNEVPVLLAKLKPNTQPIWGHMTAQHMLEHLQYALSVTTGAKLVKVVSPWYARPFLKLIILSDRPFPKNFDLPGSPKSKDLPALKYKSLEEAKANLIRAIEDTLYFIRKSPEVRTSHPLAGKFTPNEWRIFHRKHFMHHFRQFGLLP